MGAGPAAAPEEDMRNQRRQPRVRRRKVVQPPGGEELPLAPENRRWLRVRNNDVVPANPGRINRGAARHMRGQNSQQVHVSRVAQPPHGIHVPLFVEREPVVHGAVQVDGQLREAQHRAGGREVLRAVQHDQPAGQLQLPVQPGVQQRPAVDLDAGLQPAVGTGGGLGLELEGRGVRVRAQDVEPGGGSGAFRNHPGDEGAVADDVERARAAFPWLQLVQARETRLVQPACGLVDGVEARRRRADVCAKVLDVVCGAGIRRHGLESNAGPRQGPAAGHGFLDGHIQPGRIPGGG